MSSILDMGVVLKRKKIHLPHRMIQLTSRDFDEKTGKQAKSSLFPQVMNCVCSIHIRADYDTY